MSLDKPQFLAWVLLSKIPCEYLDAEDISYIAYGVGVPYKMTR